MSETHAPPTSNQRRDTVDKILGNLLSAGVISSVAVIVVGLALLFFQHPDYLGHATRASDIAGRGTGYPHTPLTVLKGALHLEAPAVIMLGLLLLIITPVLRVITSIAAFIFQRDWIFTAITTTVLLILILAFWLGKL